MSDADIATAASPLAPALAPAGPALPDVTKMSVAEARQHMQDLTTRDLYGELRNKYLTPGSEGHYAAQQHWAAVRERGWGADDGSVAAEADAAQPVSDVRRYAELSDVATVLPPELGVSTAHVDEMDSAVVQLTAGVPLPEGSLRALKGALVEAVRSPRGLDSAGCLTALTRMCGGEASAMEEVALAKEALPRFAEAGFSIEFIERSGVGNSPDFVRAMARIGRGFRLQAKGGAR